MLAVFLLIFLVFEVLVEASLFWFRSRRLAELYEASLRNLSNDFFSRTTAFMLVVEGRVRGVICGGGVIDSVLMGFSTTSDTIRIGGTDGAGTAGFGYDVVTIGGVSNTVLMFSLVIIACSTGFRSDSFKLSTELNEASMACLPCVEINRNNCLNRLHKTNIKQVSVWSY